MAYSALTTVFTPPATCTTAFSYYAFPHPIESETTYITQDIYSAPTRCYPPGYNQTPTYSPGVCPSAFTTATFEVSGSVTTAFCCPPSGYHFAGLDCQSAYTTSTTVLITNGSSTYMGGVGPGTAAVPYIVVLHSSGDLPKLHWASLSTGSKAGIGVGSAVLLCLVLGAVLFLYRRRTKKQRDYDPKFFMGKQELDGIGVERDDPSPHELYAEEVQSVIGLHGGPSSSGTRSSQHDVQVSRIAATEQVEEPVSTRMEHELSAAHDVSEAHDPPIRAHEMDNAQDSILRPAEKARGQHPAMVNAESEIKGPFYNPVGENGKSTSLSVRADSVPNNEVEEEAGELRMLVEAERRGWTS